MNLKGILINLLLCFKYFNKNIIKLNKKHVHVNLNKYYQFDIPTTKRLHTILSKTAFRMYIALRRYKPYEYNALRPPFEQVYTSNYLLINKYIFD